MRQCGSQRRNGVGEMRCYFRDRDRLKRFDVEIERCGQYAVVRPVGELDLAAVDILESALSPLETEFGKVVIDLRQVEFLDSTGLRVILSADARSRSDGFKLEVINGTGAGSQCPGTHRDGQAPAADRRRRASGRRLSLLVRVAQNCVSAE